MRRFLFASALAALALPAAAADGDNIEGQAGSFRIVHLWADDQQRFLEQWSQPTPPSLTTTSRFERNETGYQFIIFANCQADAAGNCSLSAKVDVIAPDGSAYGEPLVWRAWDDQPAPPRDLLVLAPSSMALTVEDGEQLGLYRIELAVTDENAGVTATSRVTLTVVEAGEERAG